MKAKQEPTESRARVRFGSVEFDGSTRFVLIALSFIACLVIALYFLPVSPFHGTPPTTVPTPGLRDGVIPPHTDPQTDGSGESTGGGGGDTSGLRENTGGGTGNASGLRENIGGGGRIPPAPAPAAPAPPTLTPTPTPTPTPPPTLAPPLQVAKGSFDSPFNDQQIRGSRLPAPATGTIEDLSTELTLLCIVKGTNAPYFFYDTYGDTHGVKGTWNSEPLIGPNGPFTMKFTLILATATQSAVDEINGKKTNGDYNYNTNGLPQIPLGIETLSRVVINRTS